MTDLIRIEGLFNSAMGRLSVNLGRYADAEFHYLRAIECGVFWSQQVPESLAECVVLTRFYRGDCAAVARGLSEFDLPPEARRAYQVVLELRTNRELPSDALDILEAGGNGLFCDIARIEVVERLQGPSLAKKALLKLSADQLTQQPWEYGAYQALAQRLLPRRRCGACGHTKTTSFYPAISGAIKLCPDCRVIAEDTALHMRWRAAPQNHPEFAAVAHFLGMEPDPPEPVEQSEGRLDLNEWHWDRLIAALPLELASLGSSGTLREATWILNVARWVGLLVDRNHTGAISPESLRASFFLEGAKLGARRFTEERGVTRELATAAMLARFSPAQTLQFERLLEEHPDSIFLRCILLGVYFRRAMESPPERAELLLWLLSHHPRVSLVGKPETTLSDSFQPETYLRALQIWLGHILESSNDSQLLWNAAHWFFNDEELGEALLFRGLALQPEVRWACCRSR